MNRLDFSPDSELLKLLTQYEYFKRNSKKQAHKNINKMIMKEVGKEREETPEEPVVRRGKRKRRSSGTALRNEPKKMREGSKTPEIEVENVNPTEKPPKEVVRCQSDNDSENAEMEENQENDKDVSVFKLKEVSKIYEKMASNEILEILFESNNGRTEMTGAHILKLLSINRSTTSTITHSILPPIDNLHVIIGFQKVIFEFNNAKTKEWTQIEYWRNEKTSLIWYGNTVVSVKGLRYQTLAANDFFYLVQHPKAKFNELNFDIEKYRKGDPRFWPFSVFIEQIEKLLKQKNVKVKNWSMMYFRRPGDSEFAPRIIQLVWGFIDQETLETIRIRRWNDKHIEDGTDRMRNYPWGIWHDQKWKQAKKLKFDDEVVSMDFEELVDIGNDEYEDLVKNFMRTPPSRIMIHTAPSFDWPRAISFTEKRSEQKPRPNTYFFPGGLVMRSEMEQKRIVLMRR